MSKSEVLSHLLRIIRPDVMKVRSISRSPWQGFLLGTGDKWPVIWMSRVCWLSCKKNQLDWPSSCRVITLRVFLLLLMSESENSDCWNAQILRKSTNGCSCHVHKYFDMPGRKKMKWIWPVVAEKSVYTMVFFISDVLSLLYSWSLLYAEWVISRNRPRLLFSMYLLLQGFRKIPRLSL